jgi:tetratricopeptide (TPR) repeat protein
MVLAGCGERDLDNYTKGVKYLESGQIVLAEQQFKIALQKNPELAEAHLNLGVIYEREGWYDGAVESTRRSLEILERTKKTCVEGSSWQQTVSKAYGNLGVYEIKKAVIAESQSDRGRAKDHWILAMGHFEKAVELDPTNASAQANLQKFKNAY